MAVQLDVNIWLDDDRLDSYRFSFVGIDCKDVSVIMEKNFGFNIEWLGGEDFEFDKIFNNYVIGGICWGGIYDNDGVIVINSNRWVVETIIGRVIEDVQEMAVDDFIREIFSKIHEEGD